MKKVQLFMVSAIMLVAVSCKKKGCTDLLANNYSIEAEKDDGSCDFSATIITDDITTNTTWTAGKSYVVENTITVSNNATLIIQAGTIIRFKKGVELDVSTSGDFGTIKAMGTPLNPILFTSDADVKAKGDWDGIWFYEGANGCEMNYCEFEYSGGYFGAGALNIKTTEIAVVGCTFRNSEGYGVEMRNNNSGFTDFRLNTFLNNDVNDIKIYADYLHTIGTGNIYDKNIDVLGGDVDIPGDVRWGNQGAELIFDGTVYVGSATGTKLIIEAGNILKFGSSDEVSVGSSTNGLIEAIGTASSPIVFTSKSAYPTKGDWDGIWFYSGSANGSIIEYCTISYGGGYAGGQGNIVYKFEQGSKVTVRNSTLSYSPGFGMMLDQVSSDTSYPTLLSNTYIANDLGDKNW
jgi:hypothetical protein